jgi:hypothetical protein
MGDIADGLINGDFYFFTGEYLGEGGGFPRTRNGSLSGHSSNYGKNPLKGVQQYLRKRGFITKKDHRKLMEDYIGEDGKQLSNKQLAELISIDFGDLVKFVNKNLR